MAEDIGIELHDKIKAAFDVRCGKDSTLTHIRRKVENGTATMEDTSIYARRMGELLRKSIESTTKPDDLPGEKMYFNIAQSILEPLLRGNYDDVNAICEKVQSALDAKKGIGLKPQKADFPAERVRAAIGGAAVKETAEHAIQVLGRTAENITGSFQTDYIKKNAEFRSKAGLNCYIERKDGFRCCDWCAGLAGRYRYPDEVPKDVYRRHDNCTCDVSYVSEKGRQNVHSKQWANEQAKAQRIEYAASVPKPMKLTKAEAQAKQSEILAQRRLTYDGKRGIINTDKENGNRTIYGKISKNAAEYLKQLQNEGDFIRGKADDFTMLELAEMSRFTGVEFGKISFQLESIIVRGNEKGTTFPEDVLEEAFSKNGRFEYHSHPYDDDLYPSKSDEKLLALFKEKVGQNTSKIVAPNEKYSLFSCDGTAYIKSLNADNTIDEEYADELRKLFGGD